MARILIVGGYGMFGSRVAERLAREADLEIVIAGRDGARARVVAEGLRGTAKASISHGAVDAMQIGQSGLDGLAPAVVVNASGPFQAHDYSLARACIATGCHYVDLADARDFVTGITALDTAAKAAGVLVVSGASTVPGLSSAVVKAHEHVTGTLTALDIGVSPGNNFDPGEATAASILSYVGRPFAIETAQGKRTVFGWQGLGRHRFPVLGNRWMGHVDLPDLDLFPQAYPRLAAMSARAGVEVGLFHLGLWGLSWLVRAGLIRHPERLARPLLRAKRQLSFVGSDMGGMFITMSGLDRQGDSRTIDWHLIAGSGHGPYVPAMASVILAKRLARRAENRTGAMPCFGLFTLGEFVAEVADLDIEVHE